MMKIKFRYIFSLLLLIFGIYEMIHWYVLKDTKVEIEAIVTDIDDYSQTNRHGPNSIHYRISVEYEYNGKKNTTFIEEKDYEDIDVTKIKKGDVIKLYINPNNPFEVFNPKHTLMMGISSIAMGGLLLFIFIKLGKHEKLSKEEREAIRRMVQERRLPK